MNQKQIDALAELIYQHSPMSREHSRHVAEVLEGDGCRKQSEADWQPIRSLGAYVCDACTKVCHQQYTFCPHCGAKMKGGAE